MAGTMISDLTDGIINYIISLLPTEDAVRTSILAKRWRYFWTFLTVLDLKSRWSDILDFPNGIRFPLLKTLNLSHVTFTNENSIQQLFALCPLLQELTLYECCWANIQQITIENSTLRILTIVHHDYAPCTVKIDAANLISLSYTSYSIYPIVELLSVNLTSVVDAYIDIYIHIEDTQYALYEAQCVIHLLSGLNTVKSLKLSNDTLEFLDAKDSLHLLPLFHNLTLLRVLSRQFDGVSGTLKDFLPKTPKLEVLQIQTGFNSEIWTLNSMPCCFKSSLKLVCISEFFGEENQIEFVRFLLENATTLREIKIFWLIDITSDLKMLDDIKNQLQPSPFSNCVITFQ